MQKRNLIFRESLKHVASILLIIICYSVQVKSQDFVEELESKLRTFKNEFASDRVYLEIDRFEYQSGDPVWFQSRVMDIFKNDISESGSSLKIDLQDTYRNTYYTYEFSDTSGLVASRLVLPEYLENGIYYLNARTDRSFTANPYQRIIKVRKSGIPDFIMTMDFPDQPYYPGDNFAGIVRITDYFSEPIRGVECDIEILNGKRLVTNLNQKTQGDGMLPINFKVPTNLENGILSFSILARNSEGSGSLEGYIPLYSENYYVSFFPEGKNMVSNTSTVLTMLISNAHGCPMSGEAMIIDEAGKVIDQAIIDSLGLVSFKFVPRYTHRYYFRLLEPFLSEKIIELPPVLPTGYNLVKKSTEGKTINLEIINTTGSRDQLSLIGLQGGQITWHSSHKSDDNELVSIPKSHLHQTSCYFTLFDSEGEILAERLIQLEADDDNFLKIEPNKKEYAQREKVMMEYLRNESLDHGVHTLATFSAIHEPWSCNKQFDAQFNELNIPLDYYEGLKFLGDEYSFSLQKHTKNDISLILSPGHFTWNAILGKKPVQNPWDMLELVVAKEDWNKKLANNNYQRDNGRVIYRNTRATSYFIVSNPDYLKSMRKVVKNDKPAYKYLLENGTDLPRVIFTMKPYEWYGNKIVFYGSRNSLSFQDGALIVVDGIQVGQDGSVLNNINPYDVDEINISTLPMDIQRYTGFNSVGVIEIDTKRGMKEEPKINNKKVPEEFYSPDYGSKANRDKGKDFRKTVFWHTQNASLQEELPLLEFFNSDLRGKVKVRANLFTTEGRAISVESKYDIR
jgi:hypothetical protein